MSVVMVTGSGGLVGSETSLYFLGQGFDVVGIDNDMRAVFFGEEASTAWRVKQLEQHSPRYRHLALDIRDQVSLHELVKSLAKDLTFVVHAAAQPSHDWAARDPFMDFSVNANGTLNILEALRRECPTTPLAFMSTNKVYGDTPNRLCYDEKDTRWELCGDQGISDKGFSEEMSIDQSTHSVFGASKVAADILVQEYGRYFGMPTACFRGGCLTGGAHSGTELHGFLAYLMKCTATGQPYSVFGHKGKQVRDNIHSQDLVKALWAFGQAPGVGKVYNIGGSRFANCSMLEAIEKCEAISGKKLNWQYEDKARTGDHIWWVSDISRFSEDYPEFQLTFDIDDTLEEIFDIGRNRW